MKIIPSAIRYSLPAKLYRYVTKKSRIPRMPRGYVIRYTTNDVDDDSRILMQARVAKDPMGARRVMQEYDAKNAYDVLSNLPPSKERSLISRLVAWARRAEGSYPYDPVATYVVNHLNDDNGIYL